MTSASPSHTPAEPFIADRFPFFSDFLSNLKAKHEERKHVAQAGEIALQEKIQVAEDRQWPDQQSKEIAERYQEILGIQGVISEMKTRNPSVSFEFCQGQYLALLTFTL